MSPKRSRRSGSRSREGAGKRSNFYKFVFTGNRGDSLLQLGSVQLFQGDNKLEVKKVTNPRGGSPYGEEPRNVLHEARRGKWLDFNFERYGQSELLLEMKGGTIESYELWTANDCPGRDPTQWTLLVAGAADGPWEEVDAQAVPVPPAGRFAPYGSFVVGFAGSAMERRRVQALKSMLELGIDEELAEFALEHEDYNVEHAVVYATSSEGIAAFNAAFVSPSTLERVTTKELSRRWQQPHKPMPEYAKAADGICVVPELMGKTSCDNTQHMLEAAMLKEPLEGDFEDLAAEVVCKAYGLRRLQDARHHMASFPGVAEGNFFEGICRMHRSLGWRGRYFHAALREAIWTQDAGTLQAILALSKRGAEECQARKVYSYQAVLRYIGSSKDETTGDGSAAVDFDERARRQVMEQIVEFLDERKEKAFKSTFEEPTKMYFQYVGDHTMEGDAEVHGSNVYLAVLLATLGIKMPREPHMSDEAKGICMFLDANLGEALQKLWHIDNLGKPYTAVAGTRASPSYVARNLFVFPGATPKAVANAAIDESSSAARRLHLAPYLEQFASYFHEEKLLQPLVTNLMLNVEHDLQTCYTRMREDLISMQSQMVSADLVDPDDVKKTFQQFDLNASGTIELEELCSVFHKIGGASWPVPKLACLLESMDMNCDGSVDYGEFVDFIWTGSMKEEASATSAKGVRTKGVAAYPEDYREFLYDIENDYEFSASNASMLLRDIGALKAVGFDGPVG